MPAHPEKVIGDSTYKVRPLGGKDSRRVQYLLAKAIGGALSTERGVDVGLFLEAAKGFKVDCFGAFQALPYEEFDWMCTTFVAHTTVTYPEEGHAPKTAKLDTCYESQMGGAKQSQFIPWFLFCLEVNFGEGFFSAARDALARAKAKSKSASPPESTGSSGDSTSATG